MSPLRLEPERLASPGDLVSAFLAGDAGAATLFPPGIPTLSGDRATPARTVAPGLESATFHCPDPGARDRLEAVLAGNGLVVSTGQQPQLFGGPLYVLYKALSAVRTAADLERQLGIPCLALFWVAADDHDWPEVASIGYLDAEEKLGDLSISAPPERTGRSVGPSERLPTLERESRSSWARSKRMRWDDGGTAYCLTITAPAGPLPTPSLAWRASG